VLRPGRCEAAVLSTPAVTHSTEYSSDPEMPESRRGIPMFAEGCELIHPEAAIWQLCPGVGAGWNVAQ